MRAAHAAGAHAYLGKRSSTDELLRAVRARAAGETFCSAARAEPVPARENTAQDAALSAREREIVRMVVPQRGDPARR